MNRRMRFWLTSLPVLVIGIDMIYGLVLNLTRNLVVPKKIIAADGLPIAPEIALNWLQAAVGGGMVVVISWALWTLLQLNRRVIAGQYTVLNTWRGLALLLAALFSLPAAWEMLWLLWDIVRWRLVIHPDVRYVVVALCLPYPLFLTVKRLADNRRLRPVLPEESIELNADENLR
ncbi:MAG: hypothetical protein Q4G42_02645 [Neisseria sp.]|nr:hypothetical protein [Neisseria sp.]